MKKISKICLVCLSRDTIADLDFPLTMRTCLTCGSEWNYLNEILLNAKEV